MIIDVTPLLAPVSPEEPGGADIRDTPDYETIAAEIEKLSSPTSSGQIDWQKVESLGTRLFSSQGKDFMVAAWVATAWTMRYGIEGLGAGLILQEGLVSHYWETAQPPVKRLRGRRNALSWWIERSGSWLESIDVPPLREETHQSLVQAAETLDSRLAELAGTFAGVIQVSVPIERVEELRASLSGLEGLLTIAVHPGSGSEATETPQELSIQVLGNDRAGIVR